MYAFEQSRCAFNGGEIHSLRRLRLEGSPERLSRSWELVCRSVATARKYIYAMDTEEIYI